MTCFRNLALVGCLSAMTLLFIGCGRSSRAEIARPSPDSSATRDVERVTAGSPVRKTLTRETTQPGWIEAFEQAPLVSKVSGYIAAVQVDIGDHVTRGQTLIEISAPELQDEVRQKQAHVAQAEAELRQAEAAVVASQAASRTAEAKLASTEAGVVRAQGEFDRWNAEYDRLKELAARGSVTEKLVDETRHQLRSAQAAQAEARAMIQSAQAAIDESRANIGKAEADRGAAEARKKVAEADLAYAETMRDYLRIKSPFDGVVTRRNVDTGHYVQPAGSGSAPLLVVARTETVRVFLDVPETESELVDCGSQNADPAMVVIQALSNRTFHGQVTRTSWALDSANRSLRTEVDLNNEQGLLRPGMYATVRIRLEQKENVLTLPATAIVRHGSETFCCCIVDSKIRLQPVVLGLRVGDDYEVISGIQEQDVVVLARGGSLQSGQPVEIISAEVK